MFLDQVKLDFIWEYIAIRHCPFSICKVICRIWASFLQGRCHGLLRNNSSFSKTLLQLNLSHTWSPLSPAHSSNDTRSVYSVCLIFFIFIFFNTKTGSGILKALVFIPGEIHPRQVNCQHLLLNKQLSGIWVNEGCVCGCVCLLVI